jgi:hypothetical protein
LAYVLKHCSLHEPLKQEIIDAWRLMAVADAAASHVVRQASVAHFSRQFSKALHPVSFAHWLLALQQLALMQSSQLPTQLKPQAADVHPAGSQLLSLYTKEQNFPEGQSGHVSGLQFEPPEAEGRHTTRLPVHGVLSSQTTPQPVMGPASATPESRSEGVVAQAARSVRPRSQRERCMRVFCREAGRLAIVASRTRVSWSPDLR